MKKWQPTSMDQQSNTIIQNTCITHYTSNDRQTDNKPSSIISIYSYITDSNTSNGFFGSEIIIITYLRGWTRNPPLQDHPQHLRTPDPWCPGSPRCHSCLLLSYWVTSYGLNETFSSLQPDRPALPVWTNTTHTRPVNTLKKWYSTTVEGKKYNITQIIITKLTKLCIIRIANHV